MLPVAWLRSSPVPALLLGGLACGGPTVLPSCAPREPGTLSVVSTAHVNPDDQGRPLPTVVRVYQLAGLGELEAASFDEIHAADEDVLGEALLARDELTIYPQGLALRAFERHAEASHVVGVGIFRRPSGLGWRSALPLPPPAADGRCAARRHGAVEPQAPLVVRVRFRLEGSRIEGALGMEGP
ncbi:MAG: type VI secretion system lipoprotein TssJ [Sandaracinaceae bacterium]